MVVRKQINHKRVIERLQIVCELPSTNTVKILGRFKLDSVA